MFWASTPQISSCDTQKQISGPQIHLFAHRSAGADLGRQPKWDRAGDQVEVLTKENSMLVETIGCHSEDTLFLKNYINKKTLENWKIETYHVSLLYPHISPRPKQDIANVWVWSFDTKWSLSRPTSSMAVVGKLMQQYIN